VDDWLVQQFTFFGLPLQNWMVVILATIVAALLVAMIEDG
jgi:hypothetical protein